LILAVGSHCSNVLYLRSRLASGICFLLSCAARIPVFALNGRVGSRRGCVFYKVRGSELYHRIDEWDQYPSGQPSGQEADSSKAHAEHRRKEAKEGDQVANKFQHQTASSLPPSPPSSEQKKQGAPPPFQLASLAYGGDFYLVGLTLDVMS
jgi:hypothetical protein